MEDLSTQLRTNKHYLYFRDRNNDVHKTACRIFLTNPLKETNFFIHYVEIPYRNKNQILSTARVSNNKIYPLAC